jgi:hypothetical protein
MDRRAFVGRPEGLHWTYTEGVISQIRPRFHCQADGRVLKAFLQR